MVTFHERVEKNSHCRGRHQWLNRCIVPAPSESCNECTTAATGLVKVAPVRANQRPRTRSQRLQKTCRFWHFSTSSTRPTTPGI